MNTVASAHQIHGTSNQSAPTSTDQKGRNPVDRAFGLLASHMPEGVTPISLAVSALAAVLGGFGSSSVVAQQGSLVIAFAVLVGIQVAWILLKKWSPPRLRVADTPDANAIHPLTPYLSTRRAGAPSLAGSQPERDGDVKAVVDMLTGDANVSILYGDPGNGKTSLVHGAVIPTLEAGGWRVWYVGSADRDPVGAAIQAGVAAGTPRGVAAVDWPTLKAMVQAAQAPAPGLVIVFDHIQRLLLRTLGGPAQEDQFWTELAEVVGSGVRMLLISRTDTLPLAIQAVGKIDSSLADEPPQHELTSFTTKQALDALVAVVRASGLALEERLARSIVQELATNNQVSPAQLQLVLDTLFWSGELTLPGYRRARSAQGAERRFFTTRWRDRVKDRGGDPDAQTAVLARLAGAEPAPKRGANREGLAVDRLGATDDVLNALYTDHLIERLRSGAYRLAEPGLASPLRALGAPQSRLGRWRTGAGANLGAAVALCGHVPRLGLALVLAAMVAIVGLVVYLIVAGYPQGRLLASLPVVVSAGGSALDLVAFDQHGDYLAADVGDQIVVWDRRKDNAVYRRLSKAAIDSSFVTNYLAFFEPDEVRLFGVHGEVWAWQLSTGNFIRQDEKPIAVSSDSGCSVSAATVNSRGRLLAEGTSCGELRVLDVDARVPMQTFTHHDPKCRTLQLAFSRAENQLLEFYRCKSANDVLQLTQWPLTQAQAGADSTPSINGQLVKVEYLADGNPYVLTVTQAETHLWEMARSLARSRWPLAVYDGAPTDLAPDGRVLAVGFAGEIRLYERAEWPFEFIPVKDSAKGLLNQASPTPQTQ